MNELQRCAGLNISSSGLQLVEVEKLSDQYIVSSIDQASISPPINFVDIIDSATTLQIQNAFDEIKNRNSIKSSLLSFTLPPELFVTIQLPYDNNLQHNEVIEEFRWELSMLFPFQSADELAVKYYQLGKQAPPGSTLALVVAVNKKNLLFCKNFCKKNNITPRFVDNASVSVNYLINNNFRSENGSVSINVYYSSASLTLFINNLSKPFFVKEFSRSNENYLKTLSETLSKEMVIRRVTIPDLKAFVTGENINDELISSLNSATDLNFKRFNPFDMFKVKNGIINSSLQADNFISFIPAVGIASRFN
jgi:Tfp pilus assembly PilM family ATPase